MSFFLKEEFKNQNWKVGVQIAWLQDEFNFLLKITRSYFTYEGNFNKVNIYHFHFLAYLACQFRMNGCFYLLASLKHMTTFFRERTYPSPHYVYHKTLIKLSIENQLEKSRRIWSHFLFWGGFQPLPLKDLIRRKKSIKQGRKTHVGVPTELTH